MNNLFLDTSNSKLVFILEKNNNNVDFLQLDAIKRQSELFIPELKTFIDKNNVKLNQLNNIYVLNGPGSYTGIKVGLTFVKTLCVLNKEINVYVLNSLNFQISQKNTISLIDARGNKFYCGVYSNLNESIFNSTIKKDELETITKKYLNYNILKDYKNVDYQHNFKLLKKHFKKIKNFDDLEPCFVFNNLQE